jgi:hypothetical protein
MNQLSDDFPNGFIGNRSALRKLVDPAVNIGIAGSIKVINGFNNACRLLGAGGTIEKGKRSPTFGLHLIQDREILANPIAIEAGSMF